MSVSIVCPCCGKVLRGDESLVGKRVRCRGCGDAFVAVSDGAAGGGDDVPILASDPEHADQSGKATAALILGVLSLIGWCLPIVGLPMTIAGLVLGIKGRASRNGGFAIAGIVLNIVGLVLSVVNAAIGAYLGATGQHPLLR